MGHVVQYNVCLLTYECYAIIFNYCKENNTTVCMYVFQ